MRSRSRAPVTRRNAGKPVVVDMGDDEVYHVHFGRPGHPKIYRLMADSGRLVGVPRDDRPCLDGCENRCVCRLTWVRVAEQMQKDRAEKAEAEKRARLAAEAEKERRKTWRYRFAHWLGRKWAWFWKTLLAASGPS